MNDSEEIPVRTLLKRLDVNLPVRLLGFGFIYAWGVCLWDIPLAASNTGSALQADPAWLLSAILTPISCLALAFAGRARGFTERRELPLIASLLCTGGTACVIACGYVDGWARAVLTLAAGIGTGCGPALLVVLWGCLFARVETSLVETVIPASFVVTLLCALVTPSLAAPVAGALVALFPLVSGFLLVLSRNSLERGGLPSASFEDFKPLSVNHSTAIRMMAAVFILYCLGCAAPAESPRALPSSAEAYATVLGMFFAVTLSVAIVLFAHRINVASLYQWITLPFVAGIIATPLDADVAAFFARVLMNAVFTGIEIITMLYFIRLSQRTGRPPYFYVGLGAGAAYGGVLVGYLAGGTLTHLGGNGESAAFSCLVLLGIFALTSLLVPRHDATMEAAAQEAVPTESARESADREGVATSYDAERDALIERRCALARAHGLSNRETEIFLLLAQGRSRPYIRDSLYLSKNTVATHIRHIYEKLGIHSQQELIDLVEG